MLRTTVDPSANADGTNSVPLGQSFPRDFLVVEMKDFAPDDLIVLVTFAGDQHEIIGARLFDGVMDGFAAIGDLFVRLARLSNPFLGITKNLVWIFGAGII